VTADKAYLTEIFSLSGKLLANWGSVAGISVDIQDFHG
jgi:hypothetical protein